MDQDQFQELQMVDAAWFRLLGEVCHGSDPEALASMAENMEALRVSTGLPPLETMVAASWGACHEARQ